MLGLRKVLQKELILAAKPAIMAAFEFAKDFSKARAGDKRGDDFIEKTEFEPFLVALAQRLDYWEVFSKAEGQGDGKIDLKEFLSATKTIEKWAGSMADPEQEFKNLDKNGGGQILFREFCEWSVRKHLEFEKSGGAPAVKPEAAQVKVEEPEEPPARTIINPYAGSKRTGSLALTDTRAAAANREGKDGPKIPASKQEVSINLKNNLVNIQDRKNFVKKHLAKFEVSDNLLINKLVNGEKLVLYRLIGHPEFEPARAPLFTLDQVEEAKIAIAEERRAQVKAGNAKYPSSTPSDAASAATPAPKSLRDDIRQVLKTGPRVYRKDAIVSSNIRWGIGNKCWNCEGYRYVILFYQRSKADIWFHKEESSAHMPASIV